MKVLTWKCPDCGKVIESLYFAQLEANKQSHIITHKKGDTNG